MNRRLEWALFLGLMLLAGALRMGWPGITEFKLDEARDYTLALNLVEFKSLPLTATDMSVGLPNSPLTIYIYALPMVLWKSPLAPMLFGALLNTAAVGLVYALVRRYWGPRAALLSGLLYAAAPWAVLYSRKIWASNLLPLFLAGYVFSGLLSFVEGRRRWVLAHLALLSVIVQIHISSLALAPVTLGLLLVYRRRVDWRWVGAGVAAALLLEVPFGVYLATQAGALQPAAGSALAGRTLQVTGDVFTLAAMLVQGTYVHSLAGAEAYRAFDAGVPDFTLLLWLGGVLVVLGAGLVLQRAWRAWRSRERAPVPVQTQARAGLVLVVWLLMPLAVFVAHVSPVYPHYLTILFVLSFALSGIFLDWLMRVWSAPWQRVVVGLLPVALAGCQTWLVVALYGFLGMHATPGAFGVPLEKLLQVADSARRLGAPEVLVVSDGSDPWQDNTPAVFDVLLNDVPRRFVDGRTTAVLPANSAAVILWPGNYPVTELYRQWSGGQWAAVVPLRPGEGEVDVAKGGGASPVPRPRDASALLSNGAEVLGSGGDAQHWELWWRAPDGGAGEDYHVFAHLLDAKGEPVAQMDEPTAATRYWRADDLVVNYFELKAPSSGAQPGVVVQSGMYAYPSLTPVNVLDAAGNPAGQWLPFPVPH